MFIYDLDIYSICGHTWVYYWYVKDVVMEKWIQSHFKPWIMPEPHRAPQSGSCIFRHDLAFHPPFVKCKKSLVWLEEMFVHPGIQLPCWWPNNITWDGFIGTMEAMRPLFVWSFVPRIACSMWSLWCAPLTEGQPLDAWDSWRVQLMV